MQAPSVRRQGHHRRPLSSALRGNLSAAPGWTPNPLCKQLLQHLRSSWRPPQTGELLAQDGGARSIG